MVLVTLFSLCDQVKRMLTIRIRHFQPALDFVKGASAPIAEHGFGIYSADFDAR